jgi:hypothetical protein
MYRYALVRWLACGLAAGYAVAFSASSASDAGNDRQSLTEVISQAPPVLGSQFRCAALVRVVNRLRGLGKDRAIDALDQYAKKSPGDRRVHLICRCLFVNPRGWVPPRLGTPDPPVAEDAVKRYPAFPIAFSSRVPFLLVNDYRLRGAPESPRKCLRQCRALDLIGSDLPRDGYEKAARLLVMSDGFRELFP